MKIGFVSLVPLQTAHKSIRKVKQRPVDIVQGAVSRFDARKEIPSLNEVYRKGALLHGAGSLKRKV